MNTSYRKCIATHKKTLGELIETTRRTGNEIGLMFCEDPDTKECKIGDICTGNECTVRIDDCKNSKKIGSFHTHPTWEIPGASEEDKKWAIHENFDFFCVGGYTSTANHVRCYTLKKDMLSGRDVSISKEIEAVKDRMHAATVPQLKILAVKTLNETSGDDTDYLLSIINDDLTSEIDLGRAATIIKNYGDSDAKKEIRDLGNKRIEYKSKLRELGNVAYKIRNLPENLDDVFIEHRSESIGKRTDIKEFGRTSKTAYKRRPKDHTKKMTYSEYRRLVPQ
jgi:hypothetical protein